MSTETLIKNFSVTKVGLPTDKFTYDPDKKMFNTLEDDLTIDFVKNSGVKIVAKNRTKIISGEKSKIRCGDYCIIFAGKNSEIECGKSCTIITSNNTIVEATGMLCYCIRNDCADTFEIEEKERIKTNGYRVEGYTVLPPEPRKITKKEIESILGYSIKVVS